MDKANKRLINLVQHLESKKEEKSEVMKQFNEEIKSIEDQMFQLARDIEHGQRNMFDQPVEMDRAEQPEIDDE